MNAIKVLIILLMLMGFVFDVSAVHFTTIITPLNNSGCITGPDVELTYYIHKAADQCQLWHNNSGVWALEIYDNVVSLGYNSFNDSFDPNHVLWGVTCFDAGPVDIEASNNFSMIVTDAPYCAVLSETSCRGKVNYKSFGVFQTRLGNTKGIWLEAQDCSVLIKDSDGFIVEVFDTMIYQQQVNQFFDTQGNIANLVTPEFPVTDSAGYFTFKYPIDPVWASVGASFEIVAVCNGQTATCDFNVTNERSPIDMENTRLMGKKFGGELLIFVLIALVVAWVLWLIWNKLRGK